MSKLKMPEKGNSAAMMAELQAEHATAPPVADEAADVATASPPPASATRDDRLAFALDRAAGDEVTVVTVRISSVLNHYVDEYVARQRSLEPKSKYRKQDAVAEAFAAFYADHPLPEIPSDEGGLA